MWIGNLFWWSEPAADRSGSDLKLPYRCYTGDLGSRIGVYSINNTVDARDRGVRPAGYILQTALRAAPLILGSSRRVMEENCAACLPAATTVFFTRRSRDY